MSHQGHNRLGALKTDLTDVFERIVHNDGMFHTLRTAARQIALEYPEFTVWSPELRGGQVVSDIWDRSGEPVEEVRVRASKAMVDAPMW